MLKRGGVPYGSAKKTLLIAERTFRRLDTPALLADVANGVVYVDGMRQQAAA